MRDCGPAPVRRGSGDPVDSRGVGTRRSCRRTRWSRSGVRRPGRRCSGWWGCIVSCSSGAGRGRESAMLLSSSTGFRLIESAARWNSCCRALRLQRRRVPSQASSYVVGPEVRRMADPRSESAARRSMWQSAARWTRALGIPRRDPPLLTTFVEARAADLVNNCCRGSLEAWIPPGRAVRSLLRSLVTLAWGGRQVLGQGRRCGCDLGCAWAVRVCGVSCAACAGGSRLVAWAGEPGKRLVWTSPVDETHPESPPERIYGASICRLLHVFVGCPGRSFSSDFGADGFSLLAAYEPTEPLRVPEPAGVRRPSPVWDGRRRARTINRDGSVADRCDSVGGVASGPSRGPGARVRSAHLALHGGRPYAGVWP